jgi:hypothetical protein
MTRLSRAFVRMTWHLDFGRSGSPCISPPTCSCDKRGAINRRLPSLWSRGMNRRLVLGLARSTRLPAHTVPKNAEGPKVEAEDPTSPAKTTETIGGCCGLLKA